MLKISTHRRGTVAHRGGRALTVRLPSGEVRTAPHVTTAMVWAGRITAAERAVREARATRRAHLVAGRRREAAAAEYVVLRELARLRYYRRMGAQP